MPRSNTRQNNARGLSSLVTVFGLLSLITLAAGFLNFTPHAARAASAFNVNSTGDGADSNTADNLCNDGAGNCTLRAAVEQANATAGADTIGFSVTGTINLTGALPDITDNLTINGPGSSLLTVRRDTGGDYRIFTVDREEGRNTLVVSINGLTVANGRTPDGFAHPFGGGGGGGGGVSNGGVLTLTDVKLTGNRTGNGGSIGAGTSYGGPGGNGGGVMNFGTLTMTNVTLTGNSTGAGGEAHTAGEGGNGGAVYNVGGALTINGCVVRGNSTGTGGVSVNSAGRGGDGGGVYTFFGTLTITNCSISENRTGAGGHSTGAGGSGGAGGRGGGIFVGHGATLTGISVSDNVAGGGGIATSGTPGGGGQGGGIFFDSGIGVLTNSTVSGNTGSVAGAILNRGDLSIMNSTVSGNRLNGPGGAVRGGTLTNCTITANEGPGLSVGAVVRNTIVAGNAGGTGPDVSGSFNSQGHNLVGNGDGSTGFNAAGDQVGSTASPLNARLGTLADNGGPTLTHALLAGSPALDAGNNALAVDRNNNPLTTDQRGLGFPRIADAADADTTQTVDIGAFETLPSIEDSSFFVRQHYLDFLSREPDALGLAFWTNELNSCGADAQCVEVKRVNVSAAFFLSIEFQETGYFVIRVYKAAFGDATSPNVMGTVPVIRFREFLADSQLIGRGVRVNVDDWRERLEANKQAYMLGFVQRPRFTDAYPATMTAEEFVSKLDQNAGHVLSVGEQSQLVASLAPAPSDTQLRAAALRHVAESATLRQRELNRAFVLMEYFGYLRRNPDDAPDADFGGWRFWLNKLDEFQGNYVAAEMVKAFITSDEYRRRFGQ